MCSDPVEPDQLADCIKNLEIVWSFGALGQPARRNSGMMWILPEGVKIDE